MNEDKKEKTSREIADFRFGVIADLLNAHLSRGETEKIIASKSNREYIIPYSDRTRLSQSCIKNWLRKFRRFGKAGLLPKRRSDLTISRSLDSREKELIISKLEEKPELTAATAVRILKKQGLLTHEVSSSSLSRMIIASGLTRKERLKKTENEKTLKFNFFYPLDCVQADDCHAFMIPDDKGKKRKAILIAFIDDATRRIIYSNFSFSERSIEFEKGIKHILQSKGRITKLYVDNGATFISSQTQRILDTLGIILVHSRPYIPKGRGKIERFFRTMRDQFLRPIDQGAIVSIEDLNAKFHTWLESEYHRTPHSGIDNNTPLEAWIQKSMHIKTIDPAVNLDRIFFHEITRRVYSDSTFTLDGKLYEVPSHLQGKRIKISYSPEKHCREVFILHEGKEICEAKPVNSYANTKVIRSVMDHQLRCLNQESKDTAAKKDNDIKINVALAASKIDLLEDKNI